MVWDTLLLRTICIVCYQSTFSVGCVAFSQEFLGY